MDLASALETIRRGTAEIITEADLREKLALRRPLAIKAGFDPTAPDLHLGHTVLLRKLRQFQDLGHRVVFLIGDATALVGDPSGQSKMRKLMTSEEVERNTHTYEQQVTRLLRSESDVFLRVNNRDWFLGDPSAGLAPFAFGKLLELLSKYTVARLIERDDFRKRLGSGQEVSMLELFYPLMQGYDSVHLKADVELGGTDQKFNLLVGRDLQRAYGQPPQVVITMPLLEGTDGVQKMSKSLGNHIGLTEPPGEMFGKLMSIPDPLIMKYFTLLTDVSPARLQQLEQELNSRAINPRDAKLELATEIVTGYHSPAVGQQTREAFIRQFSQRQPPDQMPTLTVRAADSSVNVVELLVNAGIANTNNEARRLLRQGAVKLNGEVVSRSSVPAAQCEGVLQVGRQFRRLSVS